MNFLIVLLAGTFCFGSYFSYKELSKGYRCAKNVGFSGYYWRAFLMDVIFIAILYTVFAALCYAIYMEYV